ARQAELQLECRPRGGDVGRLYRDAVAAGLHFHDAAEGTLPPRTRRRWRRCAGACPGERLLEALEARQGGLTWILAQRFQRRHFLLEGLAHAQVGRIVDALQYAASQRVRAPCPLQVTRQLQAALA